MFSLSRKGVSPVIAIVLLLMMTVAAAGAAYFWITSMQSSVQQSAGSQIEAITKQASTRTIAQATICKGINEVNLVGYWKHDLGEGNETYDSSGNDNNGTLEDANTSNADGDTPPAWTDGKYGKALEFDGVDDRVNVSNEANFDFPSNYFTISFWVKPDVTLSGASDFNMFISKFDGDSYQVGWDGYGYLYAYEEESIADTQGGLTQLDANTWYHLAFVMKPDTANSKIYVNGINETVNTASGSFSTNDKNLIIGQCARGTSDFNGIIDEVRIYDKALTKAQVEYLNDTNKAMGRYVNITVYNAGVEEVPEGTWVANLKKDGTTVDSDSYNASKLPSEERITLNFYFDKMKPNTEYTIELEGTQTSTTVSC